MEAGKDESVDEILDKMHNRLTYTRVYELFDKVEKLEKKNLELETENIELGARLDQLEF